MYDITEIFVFKVKLKSITHNLQYIKIMTSQVRKVTITLVRTVTLDTINNNSIFNGKNTLFSDHWLFLLKFIHVVYSAYGLDHVWNISDRR
jgi:hypothetical protein